MNKYIKYCFVVFFILICTGCAVKKKRLTLKNGLNQNQIIKFWSTPAKKIQVGKTKNNLPVEIWKYQEKDKTTSLIFVDQELYAWAINDPGLILKELAQLEISEKSSEYLSPAEEIMNNNVNQEEQNRKTLEAIKTYQMYKETQQQIQNQQIMQTIRQQQLRPPPQPQTPVRPVQRQN